MNHKHRVQRTKDLLWRAFLIVAFLIGVVILIYHPEPALAAYEPESVNATDVHLMVYIPDTAEIDMIAQTVWGEARGLGDTEKAAVVWTILNRVDSPAWPDTITGVIAQKNQFAGYNASYPVTRSIRALVVDVVNRWIREQFGDHDVGRVLPGEYMWFTGDGHQNYFKKLGGEVWRWSLPSPYED